MAHSLSEFTPYAGVALEEFASHLLGNAALRVELQLMSAVSELHKGPFGPLYIFVNKLRAAICEALDVPLRRLQPLSVRGEWFSVPLSVSFSELAHSEESLEQQLQELAAEPESEPEGDEKATAEGNTIMDFEILASPIEMDPTSAQLARSWRSQLYNSGSPLRSGALGNLLAGSTLRVPGDTHHMLNSRGRWAGSPGGTVVAGCMLLLAIFR